MSSPASPLDGVLPPRRGLTAMGYALAVLLAILTGLTALTAFGRRSADRLTDVRPASDRSGPLLHGPGTDSAAPALGPYPFTRARAK